MMDRKEALAQKILENEDPDQIAEITARIDQLEEQMAKTRDLSQEELLEQATRPIDWLRIATVDMRTNRTAFDCEARWRNLLDVRLNQGPWTPEEDERLATVAAKWKGRNWDQLVSSPKCCTGCKNSRPHGRHEHLFTLAVLAVLLMFKLTP
ncbi:transcriptional activator Myb-like [Rhipicephalus microplus]|uniref:transcriptional activator Myb-like n=1 Tax=Rhipicephalus microplus TaxID=6941 RepID=UPI003F6BF0E9